MIHEYVARLAAVPWTGPRRRTRSRVALARELLRRLARWAEHTGGAWPFFDVARALGRAPVRVRIAPALPSPMHGTERSMIGWMLGFAATGGVGELGLPDPYLQRGGAFATEHGSMLVDNADAARGLARRRRHLGRRAALLARAPLDLDRRSDDASRGGDGRGVRVRLHPPAAAGRLHDPPPRRPLDRLRPVARARSR